MNRMSPGFELKWLWDGVHEPTPCSDALKWAAATEAMMEAGKHVVGLTKVQEMEVSTVFLPYLHLMGMLFETMVFGPDNVIRSLSQGTTEDVTSIFGKVLGFTDFQRRYRTLAEAKIGHEETVEYVTGLLASRN